MDLTAISTTFMLASPHCPVRLQHEQNDLQRNEPDSKCSHIEREQKKETNSWFTAHAVYADCFFCAIEHGKQHAKCFLQGRRLFMPFAFDPCGKGRSRTTFKNFNATASQLPLNDHPSMPISLKALVNAAGSALESMGDAFMHHAQD